MIPPPRACLLVLLQIAAVSALAYAGQTSPARRPRPAAAAAPSVSARVVKVFDGDTLRVKLEGGEETVRLLGVDCPEVAHPGGALEFYGEESAKHVRELAQGEPVQLSADERADERDSYQRLLRYVTLADGRLLNSHLIEEGFCYALTRFQFTRRSEFTRLEEEARRRGARLWEEEGVAEMRWLERRATASFTVLPMTRRSWGVRFGEHVRVRLSARDLSRELARVRAWAAELDPDDFERRLEREGWKRLGRPEGLRARD